VRNFGLVWVSGRAAGVEMDLAVRARELWEQLAVHSPAVGFRPDGSLTVARHPGELALMAEAAGRPDAGRRGLDLLDADGVRAVNPAVRGELLGGLHCSRDAIVEPGLVLGALRVTLEATGRYTWIPRRQVIDVERAAGGTAVAVDQLGERHEGSAVVLCIGDRLTGLGGRIGAALAAAPLRRCRLQMMQTAPAAERLSTALADADSMRYYPAFALPGQAGLPEPSATTTDWGMQLLLVQRAAGGLTIGDTHAYDEPFDFAVEEHLYTDLAARAEAVLGWTLPPVVRRWAGVYTGATDDRIYYRTTVDAGVVVVTGPAGRGMTLSPAIAEETWEELTR
jgi:FAD dependent oxidoreductase TIGR03364